MVFIERIKENGEQKISYQTVLNVERCDKIKFGNNYENLVENEDLNNSYCLKDFNLTLKGGFKYDKMSFIRINIYKCHNDTKKNNHKIIAVGTTSTRTLETIITKYGQFRECNGWTNIFIYPGYKFKGIDNLITNFHLPKSTLVMLVSALAGRENILNAYKIAVEEKYRFFSFGDAMFIK